MKKTQNKTRIVLWRLPIKMRKQKWEKKAKPTDLVNLKAIKSTLSNYADESGRRRDKEIKDVDTDT